MNRLLSLIVVLVNIVSVVHANWSESDIAGKHLSQGYGLDVIDHHSGTSSVIQNDYVFKFGANAVLPLTRTVKLGTSLPPDVYDTLYSAYNLGQASVTATSDFCSRFDPSYEKKDPEKIRKVSFTMPDGNRVDFKSIFKQGDLDQYLSHSNWLLDCSPDKQGFYYQVTSPSGLSFYYGSKGLFIYDKPKHTLPRRIEDAAGNYLIIDFLGRDKLTISNRFNTYVSIGGARLTVSDQAEAIASFEVSSNRKNVRVQYFDQGHWTYQWKDRRNQTVCNPLKACVEISFKQFFKNLNMSERVVKRSFSIPGQGNYSVLYDYEKTGNDELTTVADHGSYKKTYVYNTRWFKDSVAASREDWLTGTLKSERLFDNLGTYELKAYKYIPSKTEPSTVNRSKTIVSMAARAIMTEAITKRWAPNANGQMLWIGSVKKQFQDFDEFFNAQKITYSYPATATNEGASPSSADLFPSISYINKYATFASRHIIDRLAESSVLGLPYKTKNSYFADGLLSTVSKNGLITSYQYGAYDEISQITDPNLQTTNYYDYQEGIATTAVGPEGYSVSRTVANGKITSETEWGNRTTEYRFDAFGRLIALQPAEPGRSQILYSYGFPLEGGMTHTKVNGTKSEINFYNGMGVNTRFELKGSGVGTGENYHYKTEYGYTAQGVLEYESVPVDYNHVLTDTNKTRFYQYPHGLRYRVMGADGSVTNLEYIAPFTIKIVDKNGVTKIEKSRPFGDFGSEKLTEVTHLPGGDVPSAQTKISIYYLDDGSISQVNAHGFSQQYNYYSTGLLKTYYSKETGFIEYRYDNNGNLIWEKKNSDTPVSYVYDGLNRLIEIQYQDSTLNTKISYDDIGLTKVVEKQPFKWTYSLYKDGLVKDVQLIHYSKVNVPKIVRTFPAYSSSSSSGTSPQQIIGGRILPLSTIRSAGNTGFKYGKTITSTGEIIWNFSYVYSPEGALQSITYPDGEVAGFAPNRIGQPTQAGSYVNNVRYWPNGALKSITYQNGITSNFFQSSDNGQIKRIQHGTLWDHSYGFTAGAYVSQVTNNLNSAESLAFGFDQLYQLRRVSQGAVTLEKFEYSPTGDMLKKESYGNQTLYSYSATTNRLASITKNGQIQLLGYTPDGRVMLSGQKSFGYAEDKLLTEYDANGTKWTYRYDGNNNKLATYKQSVTDSASKIYHYTLYDHTGNLIHEDFPASDITSNLIYLDGRLVAKRDGKYEVDYTKCDYIVNLSHGKTYLYQRPVYLQKGEATEAYLAAGGKNEGVGGEAPVVFVGECELYSSWDHYLDLNSESGWVQTSSTTRQKTVDVRQKTSSGVDVSDTGRNWRYKKDTKEKSGNVYRQYGKSWTKRTYTCMLRFRIKREVFATLNGSRSSVSYTYGSYATGQKKTWRIWQRKPSFSCTNVGLDPNKAAWPAN